MTNDTIPDNRDYVTTVTCSNPKLLTYCVGGVPIAAADAVDNGDGTVTVTIAASGLIAGKTLEIKRATTSSKERDRRRTLIKVWIMFSL